MNQATDARRLKTALSEFHEYEQERWADGVMTEEERAEAELDLLALTWLAGEVDVNEQSAAQSLRIGCRNTPNRHLVEAMNAQDAMWSELQRRAAESPNRLTLVEALMRQAA